MTTTPGIQNLSSYVLANQNCVTSESLTVEPIDLEGDGENFISLGIQWSDGNASEYALEAPAANDLISALCRALLKLPPHHVTISLADLTGVRIDASTATVSVDGISGSSDTLDNPFPFPDWKLEDRRDHVYGDFTCRGTSDCAACQSTPSCPNCGQPAASGHHASDNLDACPKWVQGKGWVSLNAA